MTLLRFKTLCKYLSYQHFFAQKKNISKALPFPSRILDVGVALQNVGSYKNYHFHGLTSWNKTSTLYGNWVSQHSVVQYFLLSVNTELAVVYVAVSQQNVPHRRVIFKIIIISRNYSNSWNPSAAYVRKYDSSL